jgi:hypothetical protein
VSHIMGMIKKLEHLLKSDHECLICFNPADGGFAIFYKKVEYKAETIEDLLFKVPSDQ